MKYYVNKAVIRLRDNEVIILQHFGKEDIKGESRAICEAQIKRLDCKDYNIIGSQEIDKSTYILETGSLISEYILNCNQTQKK